MLARAASGARNKERSTVVVEKDRRITISTEMPATGEPSSATEVVSADLLEPLASADASLDVARVIDEDKRYALFMLHGDLSEGTAPQLLEHLVAAARRTAVDLVIVDLSQVNFLSAAGASCLEAALRAGERLGAQVVASRPSRFARQILQTAGLSVMLDHEPDFTDAGADDPRFDDLTVGGRYEPVIGQ
jgi:anti-anti-sigma factor